MTNPADVPAVRSAEGRSEDEVLDALAVELQSCGLTLNEARVYTYLLANGASPVNAISKDMGLHRVEVYRKLHDLGEAGLLETYLDRPKRYAAVDPNTALSTLVRKEEVKLAAFKLQSRGVLSKLEKLGNSANTRLLRREAVGEGSYRLVRGRKKYYDEIARLAGRAENEILRIVSPGGVVRTMLAGTDEEYARAKSRGVSIRMLCEVNPRNRSYARRLAGIVQLRHLEGVRLRFTLIDRSVTVLGARFDEASESLDSAQDAYVVFEDARFSEAFRMFFEYLWAQAEPVPHGRTARRKTEKIVGNEP